MADLIRRSLPARCGPALRREYQRHRDRLSWKGQVPEIIKFVTGDHHYEVPCGSPRPGSGANSVIDLQWRSSIALTRGGRLRAKIKWLDDEDGHLVTCDEEFRHALAKAEENAARRPLIAEVTLDDGDCLSIGLGREFSVLSYVGASKKPPYFSSQGPARVRDGEGLVFHYYGHWSEFPPSAAVPMAEAVEAVRYFCEHGKLSTQMNWVEV